MERLDKRRLVLHGEPNALDSAQTCQRLGNGVKHTLLLGAHVGRVASTQAQLGIRRRAVGTRRRRVGLALGDAHADARRRAREQIPQKRGPASGHGGGDVSRGVAQADGEDEHVGRAGEQAGAERQDGLAVCRGALGEDGDGAVGVLPQQVAELDEVAVGGGGEVGGEREGGQDSGEEPDAADAAGARVGEGEDGVKDGGEVDDVDGARPVGGDDGAAVREAAPRLVGERAALDAVELQVHPPDAGDAQQAPEGHLARDDGQRQVLEQAKVAGGEEEEEREAEREDERVVGGADGGEGRRDGEEGCDARGPIAILAVFLHD